jgi:plastocyanin
VREALAGVTGGLSAPFLPALQPGDVVRHRIVGPIRAPAALLLVLAVSALAASGAADRQVTVHYVEISVDTATGTLSYSLDPVLAEPGDQIEWTSDVGGWSVYFVDRTPLNKKSLRARRRGRVRRPVRPDAAEGSYKYFVAVAVGEDVFIDDPVVIVRPAE